MRPIWLNKAQLAEHLSLPDKRSIDYLLQQNKLPPPVRLSDRVPLWDMNVVDAWLSKRQIKAAEEAMKEIKQAVAEEEAARLRKVAESRRKAGLRKQRAAERRRAKRAEERAAREAELPELSDVEKDVGL